jgi:hypothetical protein
MWCENGVGNVGLGEKGIGYEMLVGKGEGKLLEALRVYLQHLRANIDVSIKFWLIYFFHISRSVN